MVARTKEPNPLQEATTMATKKTTRTRRTPQQIAEDLQTKLIEAQAKAALEAVEGETPLFNLSSRINTLKERRKSAKLALNLAENRRKAKLVWLDEIEAQCQFSQLEESYTETILPILSNIQLEASKMIVAGEEEEAVEAFIASQMDEVDTKFSDMYIESTEAEARYLEAKEAREAFLQNKKKGKE